MAHKNVLVAGATGKTGRQVVRNLIERGYKTTALVRETSDTSVLPEEAELRQGDLTDLQSGCCSDMDAVVFAAGAGSDASPEMTDKVDRQGAQSLMEQARQEGVERFVMLSSIGADQENPQGELAHYLKAKHEADEHLKDSGLDYAILRPVALTDDGRSAKIVLGSDVDASANASRADVAHVLAEAVETDMFVGKALNMQSTNQQLF
ncbi:MAG: SDR family oxidoreductase [Rhodobacteraceae bacterium]|nr:SDR family oxidoreductase [Paracoccaceae bacterium]